MTSQFCFGQCTYILHISILYGCTIGLVNLIFKGFAPLRWQDWKLVWLQTTRRAVPLERFQWIPKWAEFPNPCGWQALRPLLVDVGSVSRRAVHLPPSLVWTAKNCRARDVAERSGAVLTGVSGLRLLVALETL